MDTDVTSVDPSLQENGLHLGLLSRLGQTNTPSGGVPAKGDNCGVSNPSTTDNQQRRTVDHRTSSILLSY